MCDVEERMSPDLPVERCMIDGGPGHRTLMVPTPSQASPSDQPRDLSIRRKMKSVPPPLDLSKRTLDHHHQSHSAHGLQNTALYGGHSVPHHSYESALCSSPSPKSPFLQKNLPLRKRAHSWSSQPAMFPCTISNLSLNTALSSTITTIKDEEYEPTDDYSYNKSNSNSSLRIAGLPTPHTPHTPHPHSAIPVLTSKFNFSEGAASMHHTSVPLNLSSTGSGGGIPSSLLSPAPSHPSTSSLSSSREELESEAMITDNSYQHSYPQPPHSNYQYYSSHNGYIQHASEVDSSANPNMLCVKQEHLQQSLYNHKMDHSNAYVHYSNQNEECLQESRPHSSGLYRIKDEEYYEEPEVFHNNANLTEDMSYEAHLRTSPSNHPSTHPIIPTVWSILMSGVRVHFVIKKEGEAQPQIYNARLSDELAILEKKTAEVYAPQGLCLVQSLNTGIKSAAEWSENTDNNYSDDNTAHLYFRPVNSPQEDIIALAPANHPFFVIKKGWCSLQPDECERVYGVPCVPLAEGDVCIPPPTSSSQSAPLITTSTNPKLSLLTAPSQSVYNPHQVTSNTTPDSVAEAIRRFDFSDDPSHPPCSLPLDHRTVHHSFSKLSPVSETSSYQSHPSSSMMGGGSGYPPYQPKQLFASSSTNSTVASSRNIILSPPASPSKKALPRVPEASIEASVPAVPSQARPRRPMNGFMLFAKHHRLKLIQQHPGKDNRAISVLLGATWKALPPHERERINYEAKMQAEERKKVDPDCWKRKRSQSTS